MQFLFLVSILASAILGFARTIPNINIDSPQPTILQRGIAKGEAVHGAVGSPASALSGRDGDPVVVRIPDAIYTSCY